MNALTALGSRRQAAVATGLSILLMALAAGFSLAYVLEGLFIEGAPALSLSNLKASAGLFRAGILGWLLVFVCDLVAAWGLNVVFSREEPGLSLLTAWLRLGYTMVLGVAIGQLVQALPWLTSNLSPDLAEIQVSHAIENFQAIWSMGLVVFGLHLLVLGWLALRSGKVPRWISYLLLLAGLAYFGIHGMGLLFPALDAWKEFAEMVLALPMAVAELALAGWLLWKGGKR